jgi:TetR/AcrR family transcriptional regulator, ethionamide resistance regulator
MSSAKQRAQRRIQREQARQQIRDAAVEFLRHHPFREMSVDAVMANTPLARSAFYRHFDDVTELIQQLLGEVGGELYAIAKQWNDSAPEEYAAATHQALTDIAQFFQRHGPLIQAVSDAAATDERVESSYNAMLEAYDNLIASGLDAMIADGQLEPCDTRALARALNLASVGYMLDSFGHDPTRDPKTVVKTLELIWLRVIDPNDTARRRPHPPAPQP